MATKRADAQPATHENEFVFDFAMCHGSYLIVDKEIEVFTYVKERQLVKRDAVWLDELLSSDSVSCYPCTKSS